MSQNQLSESQSEFGCKTCSGWIWIDYAIMWNNDHYCSPKCLENQFVEKIPDPVMMECEHCSRSIDIEIWKKTRILLDDKYYCSRRCVEQPFSEKVPDPSTDKYRYKINVYSESLSWILSNVPCANCGESRKVNKHYNYYGELVIEVPNEKIPAYCSEPCKREHLTTYGPYITIDSDTVYGWNGRTWARLQDNICTKCSKMFYTEQYSPSICADCSDLNHVKFYDELGIPRISRVKYFATNKHAWNTAYKRGINREQFDYRCSCDRCS